MLLILSVPFVSSLVPGEIANGAVQWLVFLYMGPETMMPLASALAAIVGALLMFWRRFVAIARRAYRELSLRIRAIAARQ